VTSMRIAVRGAGVTGLWQALTLARAGHEVSVFEASEAPFADASSRLAGAMLGPYCEAEEGGPLIRELGLRSLDLWASTYAGTAQGGTLVVALPRDRGELSRFAKLTEGHATVGEDALAGLEPDLAGRFSSALFYEREAHLAPGPAMAAVMEAAIGAGAVFSFGAREAPHGFDRIVDCRGLGARDTLDSLRGVRGERIVVRAGDIVLGRPIRLLHPRSPVYVVPWRDGRVMIGATNIESEESGPVSVRSALDLLGAAYALHPAFGEAEILEMEAGVRPAFPDNLPRIVAQGTTLHVNGLYRHGFLLAPALADLVAEHIATGARHHGVFA
jgi:glycine oxidase